MRRGTVIQVEEERGHLRKGVAVSLPEVLHTIDHEISGDMRWADVKTDFIQVREKNTEQG